MPARSVLVTGSNRGLGLAFTRQLLDRGHHVFATCRRPAAADTLQHLAATHPDAAEVLPPDVTDAASIRHALEGVASHTDRLHLLINNAGIDGGARADRFGQLDPERMARVFRGNSIGPALVTQQAAELLAAAATAGALPIVANISSPLGSIARTRGTSTWQSYRASKAALNRASKAALNMLARVMAHDLETHGVVALGLAPGWVQTDMGGAGAWLTPEASVAGTPQVLDSVTRADSGSFRSWDGRSLPW